MVLMTARDCGVFYGRIQVAVIMTKLLITKNLKSEKWQTFSKFTRLRNGSTCSSGYILPGRKLNGFSITAVVHTRLNK